MMTACSGEINGLVFAGDIGQRIFRPPFAWVAEGIEIRGRSRSLKVNYRTSRQIRRRADLLLPPRLLELDGAEEDRTGVQSVFDGPAPLVHAFPTPRPRSKASPRGLARRWPMASARRRSAFSSARPRTSRALNARSPAPAGSTRNSPAARPPPPAGSSSRPCTPQRASSSARPSSWPATPTSSRPSGAFVKPPTRQRWKRYFLHRAASALCGLHTRSGTPAHVSGIAGLGVPSRSHRALPAGELTPKKGRGSNPRPPA
jgi:hypothetical protein